MPTVTISADTFGVTSVLGINGGFGYGYGSSKGQIGITFQTAAAQSLVLAYGVPQTISLGSVMQNETANSALSFAPHPGTAQSYGPGALDENGKTTYSLASNQPVFTGPNPASTDQFGWYSQSEGTGGAGSVQPNNTIAASNAYLDVALALGVGEASASLTPLSYLASLPRISGAGPSNATGTVTLYHGYVADPDPDYLLSLGSTTTTLPSGDKLKLAFNPAILSNNPETEPLTATALLVRATPDVLTHGLFEAAYYLASNPDVAAAGLDPYQHYEQYGWHEGRNPNPFFSTSGYLAANLDVKAAGLDPLLHYDQFGWREGRDPGPSFDTNLYLLHNPDVKAAGIDPLLHYGEFGESEGRMPFAAVGPAITNGGFDAEYYLLANPDVGRSGVSAYLHYEFFGWREGRNPDAFFDVKYYLANNPDVAAAGIDPMLHYDQYGWHEGRNPSAAFPTASYLAANPDVRAAGVDPLVHYEQHGIFEGRLL